MQYRSGAELFVRDLALSLHQRGHSIVVYAPIMGDMVDELRARCIACVTELSRVSETPDLIIGNTRDETVACMARFLSTPAISICHDRTATHGQPPRLTRVRQQVAVDENCAERLYLENGIARSTIKIISNGVDLKRFRPRPRLPAQPLRAAIFSNYSTESDETAAIRSACALFGISLEVIGQGVGRQEAAPENVLPQFDLVFAKARCAMEAMAVGCAVILLNEGMGLAGLVTPGNVQEWHRWNFGRRLMQRPIQADAVAQEIQRYSAPDAEAVTSYVRQHVSLDATTDAVERLAWHVVQAEALQPPIAPQDELREFARHVADNLLPFGVAQVAVQTGMLMEQIQALEATIQRQQALLTPPLPAGPEICHADPSLEHPPEPELEPEPEPETGPKPDPEPDLQAMELSATRARVADLEHQVRALRASWSWRLTAPLRWFGAYRRIS